MKKLYLLLHISLLGVLRVAAQPPTITSFSPTSGAVGTSVIITGTNFNTTAANNVVIFGATRATVSAATTNSLTVTVPTGATYAPITVLNTATGLLAYATANFIPTFSPSNGSITAPDFSPNVDFATNSVSYSVAIGDLDGDGKADLAVPNYTNNTVSVLRNIGSIGTIGYAAKVDFATGTNPYALAIGDLDGDGNLDLAVTNGFNGTVSVLRNTGSSGTISYAAKVDFGVNNSPYSVAIGDLDGDGKADLVVANANSSNVSVLRNIGSIGTISYAAKVDFFTDMNPSSVAIGDLDGDGKADLAVANTGSNTLSVLRNIGSIGTISYAAKVDFVTGMGPVSVAIGDLDRDGKADLAVSNTNSNNVSVLRNIGSIGTISYAAKVDFATGTNPYALGIGDLDGDGKADLAVANANSNNVSVLRNIGSIGTISYAAKLDIIATGSSTVAAIGDLDGDGKADLAVPIGNKVSVNRNNPIAIEPTAQPTALNFTSVTTSSFTVNFTAAIGSPAGYIAVRKEGASPTSDPLDGTVYAVGETLGDGTIAYVGSAVTFNETSLTAGNTYYYKIYSFTGNGVTAGINYRTTGSLSGSRSPLIIEPASAPTALTFPTFTVNSLGGAFTATTAAGYIVLQRDGASPTGTPVGGTTYTVGTALGDGTVVAVGVATTFSATSLTANTVYHYDVIAYNGSGNITNYNTTARLEGSRITLQEEPIAQPTALMYSNVTISGMDVSFTGASGVDGYIVLRRSGAAPTGLPADGTTYTEGVSTIGDGAVVFVGSGTSFTRSGLTANTGYHYSVFSDTGAGAATNYLTTSPLSGSRSTLVTEPASAPTALTFPTFAVNSLGGSFTATSADGYVVLQRASASPTGIPVDGTIYNIGNTIGDGIVVAVGAATTFSATSLTANTVYFYDVIAYNGSGNIINYNTTTIMEGSRTTLQLEPTAQPTVLTFNNITVSSLGGLFTAASGSPAGYIVFRKQVSAPTFTPIDGTPYITGAQGDEVVVSSTASPTFTDAGLVAGTIYHYAVYSFNGASQAINYFTSVPLAISVITISPSPTATAANVFAQTSFTANWISVTGAVSYSLDVSADNFSNLLGGYAEKSISGISDVVTGLTPGTTYQYRVRGVNASGSSANSNTISQITIPQTPTATTAKEIRSNDFKAVWSASPGATTYELDVSQNNFASFITGYQSKSIMASLTEEIVTGLSPSTTYHYRVRSKNAGGLSPNSETITTITTAVGGNQPLTITDIVSPATILVATAPTLITASVSGGNGTKNVFLNYRAIASVAFISLAMTNTSGNLFTASVPANTSDDLGIEFFIKANAASENPESAKKLIYRALNASQTTPIPTITKFGGTLETYQIISIPYQLDDNLISSIFEPTLGAYDDTQWRLVRYQGGRNVDYQAGLTRINQGESYWFNSVAQVSVKPGSGTVAQVNQSKPYTLSLTVGWNQIATPFPFAIDWDDVLAANGIPAGIGKYKVYVPSSVSFAESNSLQPYSGGFVFADQAKDLNLPVTLKNTAGGRKAHKLILSDIGAEEWALPITLSQGRVLNPLGGIGMHPEAKTGKDDFDDITLPRFVKHLEFNNYHKEFIAPRFSKDVVPTANEHVWFVTIESNFDEGDIVLNWADADLGENEAQLLLHDPTHGVLLDMKKSKTYVLPSTSKHEIEIIYSRTKKLELGNSLLLGKPFPNPTSGEVTFNLFSGSAAEAQIEVFDLMGRKVHTGGLSLRGYEINKLKWSGKNMAGEAVTNGVYIYKLTTRTGESTNIAQGRIIIH